MVIQKFETWWVERDQCLFDEKRQGGAKMGWDVIALKLTTDTGMEGIATCMAARSGGVSENYLHDSIAPRRAGTRSSRSRSYFSCALERGSP